MKGVRVTPALLLATLFGGVTILLGAIIIELAQENLHLQFVRKIGFIIALPALFMIVYGWGLGWDLPSRIRMKHKLAPGSSDRSDGD